MRFSLNFIKEFIDIKISPENLVSILTMAGMEVEHFEKLDNDWIFDVEITTNRYDWLSMAGTAREVASCLDEKLKIKYPKLIKEPALTSKKIIIEDTDDCLFYVGRLIQGVNVGNSPKWLEERVLHCGINTVNNIVDITNYCMLKWGNPLHAFDEDKIEGNIYIRRAKVGESFIGIDDKERNLGKDNLVIADDKKIIALAGVMGAKNTEVDEKTKNIFLEAAIFSALTVRRSRRLAGIDTESSYRFERMAHPDYLEFASQEAAQLIEESAQGRQSGYKESGKKPLTKNKKIEVNVPRLNSYLGINASKTSIKKILANLGFEIKDKSPGDILVTAPVFRFDLADDVDVYEEFARLYGYEKIDSNLPALTQKIKAYSLYDFKNDLRRVLSSLGLKEIVSFSIENEEELRRWEKNNIISLLNPLSSEANALRPTLLLGMLYTLNYNLNRDISNLRFFEIGDIYFKDENNFCEIPMLAFGISGSIDDFFYLKGVISRIMEYAGEDDFVFEEQKIPNISNALLILVNNMRIGFIGKLDEKVRKDFHLKNDVFLGQIDILKLNSIRREKIYKPFSLYPKIFRDVSIALRDDIEFKEVEEIIKKIGKTFLVGLEIIDRYKGEGLPNGYDAFTLRLFYQSEAKTLTSEEVDSTHSEIRENLIKEDGVILR